MDIEINQDFEALGREKLIQLFLASAQGRIAGRAGAEILMESSIKLGLFLPKALFLAGRNTYIYELRTSHGKSANEIAQSFGISRQMVHLILKEQLEIMKRMSKFL